MRCWLSIEKIKVISLEKNFARRGNPTCEAISVSSCQCLPQQCQCLSSVSVLAGSVSQQCQCLSSVSLVSLSVTEFQCQFLSGVTAAHCSVFIHATASLPSILMILLPTHDDEGEVLAVVLASRRANMKYDET